MSTQPGAEQGDLMDICITLEFIRTDWSCGQKKCGEKMGNNSPHDSLRDLFIQNKSLIRADLLILSIRNCNSRRGHIKHLYSDCGTNMNGAQSKL